MPLNRSVAVALVLTLSALTGACRGGGTDPDPDDSPVPVEPAPGGSGSQGPLGGEAAGGAASGATGGANPAAGDGNAAPGPAEGAGGEGTPPASGGDGFRAGDNTDSHNLDITSDLPACLAHGQPLDVRMKTAPGVDVSVVFKPATDKTSDLPRTNGDSDKSGIFRWNQVRIEPGHGVGQAVLLVSARSRDDDRRASATFEFDIAPSGGCPQAPGT